MCAGIGQLNDDRAITQQDLLANMARHFSYQPERSLATALMETAQSVHRGAAREFPRALAAAEHREMHGEPPTHAPELAEYRRLSHTPVVQQVIQYARDMQMRAVAAIQQHTQRVRSGEQMRRRQGRSPSP